MARSAFLVRGSGFRAKGKGLRVARSWFLVQGSWLRDSAKGKAHGAPVPFSGLSRYFTGTYGHSGAGKIGCFSKV